MSYCSNQRRTVARPPAVAVATTALWAEVRQEWLAWWMKWPRLWPGGEPLRKRKILMSLLRYRSVFRQLLLIYFDNVAQVVANKIVRSQKMSIVMKKKKTVLLRMLKAEPNILTKSIPSTLPNKAAPGLTACNSQQWEQEICTQSTNTD